MSIIEIVRRCSRQLLFIIFFTVVALLFRAVPIDVYVSGLFFDKVQGFTHHEDILVRCSYYSAYCLMAATILVPVSMILRHWYRHGRNFCWRANSKWIYILLVCFVGPGVMVNLVFKRGFERPRPQQTKVFNGDACYSMPFEINNSGYEHYSFVSGHASTGFNLYSLAFVAGTRRRRRFCLGLATILGLTFGMARVVQGAHYISDVIFSGVVVFITAYMLAKLLGLGKTIDAKQEI